MVELPDDYEDMFKAMTDNLEIVVERPYQNASMSEIASLLGEVREEMIKLDELYEPRTDAGRELHGKFHDLTEETRMRD